MLPTTAQHRLYQHVPGNKHTDDAPIEVSYFAPDGTYRQEDVWLDVQWAEERRTTQYPCVILELSPTGVQRYDNNRLTDTVRKLAKPNDPTIAYERVEGTQLYDILNLTVACRDGVGDIPRGALTKELVNEMYAAFRFEEDYLNEPGVGPDGLPVFGEDAHVDALDWSQPMRIRPVAGSGAVHTSAMIDEQHIDRYEMQFRVEYELTHSVLVEAVEAIEYDVTLDGEHLTRERVHIAEPTVAAGRPQTASRGE